MTNETRNTNPEIQLDLLGQALPPPLAPPVGGWQGLGPPPPGGGGYLSSCTGSVVAFGAAAPPAAGALDDVQSNALHPADVENRDARIEELRQLGLGPVWVRVAEAIGYETFLAAWSVMSANRDFMDGRNRLTIPDISLLHTYQRNLAVKSLARRGFQPRQIRDEMLRSAGLPLSYYQIQHIIRES